MNSKDRHEKPLDEYALQWFDSCYKSADLAFEELFRDFLPILMESIESLDLDNAKPQIGSNELSSNDESKTHTMLLLTGEFQQVIDGKGRVLISNKLRHQIDVYGHGSNFYLVLGANGILCLYPEKYFEQIVLSVAPDATAPDEAVTFERLSSALASKVELDGQGRLHLNERLRKLAGLKEQITLVGVRDHIELWNNANWEQYLADHMEQYQKQMSQARKTVLQRQTEEL